MGGNSWDVVRECQALRTLLDRDLGKIAGGCPAEGGTDVPYREFCPKFSVLSCPARDSCARTALFPRGLAVAVLDHPVFLGGDNTEWALGEHISVSYLFTAAGELTEGLGGQWALLSPGQSCDSGRWSVSTPGYMGSMYLQDITHISLPCFLSDPWEGFLEQGSEGESEVQMGRFHFTAFSSSIVMGSRNPRPEHGGRDCSRGHGGTPLTGVVPWGLLSLRFYTTQDHLPRGGLSRAGWAPHINHRSRKCLSYWPAGQFDGGVFSTEIPSSLMVLAWVKLQNN